MTDRDMRPIFGPHSVYVEPKPHQPLITRNGVHCTCGVFCGHKLSSWRGHQTDRQLLDPQDRFNDEPVWESLYVLRQSMTRVGRALDLTFCQFKARMDPLAKAVARLRFPNDFTKA